MLGWGGRKWGILKRVSWGIRSRKVVFWQDWEWVNWIKILRGRNRIGEKCCYGGRGRSGTVLTSSTGALWWRRIRAASTWSPWTHIHKYINNYIYFHWTSSISSIILKSDNSPKYLIFLKTRSNNFCLGWASKNLNKSFVNNFINELIKGLEDVLKYLFLKKTLPVTTCAEVQDHSLFLRR